MRKQIFILGCSVVGMAFLSGMSACTSSSSQTNGTGGAASIATGGAGGSNSGTGGSKSGTGGASRNDAGCIVGDPNSTYVLIDDMETTTHGPIELTTGIDPPLAPGYWYNSGASYSSAAASDTSNPPQLSFVFSALPTPTTTLNCKASAHAARQNCTLNGLYDTCGVGFEFTQVPDGDAGVPANDAGIPMTTVPFDISRYKAITFWGMTTTPDQSTGSMQVKVQFPDTDTDPRGEICNGGGGNTSMCYNSYAAYLNFTPSWQQFTVLLDTGKGGAGGIAIDGTWGYQQAQWLPSQVYGINWQAQRNIEPTAGPPLKTDIWVDDVYFVELATVRFGPSAPAGKRSRGLAKGHPGFGSAETTIRGQASVAVPASSLTDLPECSTAPATPISRLISRPTSPAQDLSKMPADAKSLSQWLTEVAGALLRQRRGATWPSEPRSAVGPVSRKKLA